MTITSLPTPPNRASSPASFSAAADALLGALPQFVTEANAMAVTVNSQSASAVASAQSTAAAPATASTSTTSVAIAVGTKNFTIQTGKNIVPGMFVTAAYDANNYMFGNVISYAGTALSVNVVAVVGSGTFASWSIALSAPVSYLNNSISGQLSVLGSILVAGSSDDGFTKVQINGGIKSKAITIASPAGNDSYFTTVFDPIIFGAVANQAIDIEIPNVSFFGSIEVTIVSDYLGANASGAITKVVAAGITSGGGVSSALDSVTCVAGSISSNFSIGTLQWSSAKSKFIIPVSHLNALGNPLTVFLTLKGGSYNVRDIGRQITLSSVYTLTALLPNLVNFPSLVVNGVQHDVTTVNGVGSLRILKNISAGSIATGGTAAGSALSGIYWTTGSVLTATSAPAGTWKNITSGSLGNGEFGEWLRIA